jgi:AraC-like DNA-binding protein
VLTIPPSWGPCSLQHPRLPFLQLSGGSAQLEDPVQVAERMATILPVISCDAVERITPGRPLRWHLGGLRLGPLSLVAIWGPGLHGEVDGTGQASFILPYRGLGRFRLGRRSLSNGAGNTLLYLPPGPWRTSNDAMGGITIRLAPELIRQVGRSMAGPSVAAQRWLGLGLEPRMLPIDQPSHPRLFERLYHLMAFLNSLVLLHGSVPEAMRLDDLLLRQIVAVLSPALLAEPPQPDPEPTACAIDELLDWIHAHCHEPISLSELEQRSHYSRRSLQYAFKARFGCGPMQYLRRQRLWLARQRLEQPGAQASVGAVARSCGYLSLASFSRDFQRSFGIAPSSLLARGRQASGEAANRWDGQG